MKVDQSLHLSPESLQKDIKIQGQGNINFQELIKIQNEKIQSGNLHALLTEIEKAGERLAKSRNFRDLTKYKNLIQNFIKEAVHIGIGLKKSNTWDREGRSRILQIIEQIDKKMVELTDEILTKETENLKILSIIGEIKGLIVNLYT